jgi:hypothetical protein
MAETNEIKKLLDILGVFGSELALVNWVQFSEEMKDLDGEEKKEILTIAAKKVLSGLLTIISS